MDERLQIGSWALDPLAHELTRGEVRRRIPKRLVRLLQTLAADPGLTLTREQLLDRVWQRRGVGDEVLSRAIAELRNALDDDAKAPRYIETLPKTGYRLLAPVKRMSPTPTQAGPPTSEGPPPRWHGPAVGAATLLAVILLVATAALLLNQPAGGIAAGGWTPAALADARPFLSESNWVRQPRFSRDGRWLTYIEQSRDDNTTSARLVPADGGTSMPLDAGAGQLAGAQLSPDGSRLAVLARNGTDCDVRLLDLPATPARSVARCSPRHGSTLEWLDNDTLMFTADSEAGQDSGARIVRFDLGTGNVTTMTQPARIDVADTNPRLGPDGSIAFLRGPPQRQRLMMLRGGREDVLIASEDRVTDLAWTPSGEQLLIASNRNGHPVLLAVAPDSGTVETLGARGVGSFDIGPDGTLLFEQRRYVANLRMYRDGLPSSPLTDSSRYDAYPALSPDGRQLAYVSNRDSDGSVWLRALEGGAERRLDLPVQGAWSRPSWQPDGLGLLANRYDAQGVVTAFAVLPGGDLHRPLPGRASTGVAPLALADGSLLYTSSDQGRSALLLQKPSGTTQRVADDVLEFRSDGAWIGWQARGAAGLYLATLDAPEAASHLLQSMPAGRPHSWTVAQGELVYMATGEDGTSRLWRMPLPSGQARPWLVVEFAPADATIAIGPGFEFALLAGIERVEADLWRVTPPPHARSRQ